MNYNDLTKEQLIDHINSIERLNLELLKEKELETKLEYAWSGNLGHWYWDIITNSVTFNPLKVKALGYTMEEIPEPIPYQFFTDKLHPEDYQNTMQTMLDHLHGKSNVYEVEYRIQTKDGEYKWFYDRGKITQYDNNGKPVFLAGIVFDITEKKDTLLELENKNRILTEMSSIDGLTKIINHRTLIDQLKLEIIEAARTDSPLSIVLFDIDNFKKVNDSKGHVAGDQVLVDVASIMKNIVRKSDHVGRYGGEEFMVIFPKTSLSAASEISDRIRKSIEGYRFTEGLRVTISGGVSQYNNEDVTEFVSLADKNLYRAKANGKNQILW